MTGHGNYYDVDGADEDIDCVLCDASSATVEAHHRHMEGVHDC
ncbi:hypothetical protein [Halomicrobium katesii]|nr:hypothetical protein [Halomicrobium katesii]